LDLAVERALILSATGALTPHAKDCISKTIDNYENEIRRLRAESEDRKSRLDTLFKHHEAEVERLKGEKQRRVHWQDLCYHAMNAIDRILGQNVSKGTGTTEVKKMCLV
jgi:hypothetical protein